MTGTNLAQLLLNAGTQHPERIALVTPTHQVTYAELCHQALRLAAFLIEAGVQPGDRVIICLPKSTELSVAIFAALLAGGCYVPINYTTPAFRAKLIVSDAEAKAVICTLRIARQLFDDVGGASVRESNGGSRREVFVFTLAQPFSRSRIRASATAWLQATGGTELTGPITVDPAARAYILYTSGSTGRPKGVVHTHGSALSFVDWATHRLGLSGQDIISQHASPSFDLTVFDFFGSAMAAATLVSVPEWLFGQVAKTCRFIVEKRISVWYSVPSVLLGQGAVEAFQGLSRSALREVVFAGEVIPKSALQDFVRHLPSRCRVSNWYGPTETNVCTFHEITTADLESDGAVPIGMPCPYADIRLDPQIHLKPGMSGRGELLVASPTNMEGYWKLENLTAQAFSRRGEGRRYYRTGDVVAYVRGRLLFLGRKDRLLKIKGYRIQPEEVEHALKKHPAVVEAAAVPVDKDGVLSLVAVLVTRSPVENVLPDIRRHCIEMLPPYMVPSSMIRVAELPRGSRGKVDLDAVCELISPELLAGPASGD